MVNADPDMIHQVVYNLIENAVKFVNEGGTIQFTYRTEGGMTYLAVRNTGEGIAPEEIPKLFDRFYKSDRSRSLDKTGVGLGLYIVKTIIGLHGGDITVSSVQGQYSEFTFCLPAVQRPRRSAASTTRGKRRRPCRADPVVFPGREISLLFPKVPGMGTFFSDSAGKGEFFCRAFILL